MAVRSSPYLPEADVHLWRGFRSVRGQLKIGIVLRRRETAPKWVADLLNLLIAEPAVKLDVVYQLRERPAGVTTFLQLIRKRHQSLPALQKVRIHVRPACCFVGLDYIAARGLSEASQAKVAQRDLDVVIWLANEPPPTGVEPPARHGFWYFVHRGRSGESGAIVHSQEAQVQQPVNVVQLVRRMPDGEPQTLAQHAGQTRTEWYSTQSADHPLAFSGALLIRTLLDTLTTGAAPARQSPLHYLERTPHCSGAGALSQYHLQESGEPKPRRSSPRWVCAIRQTQPSANFVEIKTPPGTEYAQPFLHWHGGRHFLFFQERPFESAHTRRIGVLEIGEDGKTGKPSVALQRPHALSYPFVLAHGGDVFLLPASTDTETVPLFRARKFPLDWEHVADLVEGLPVADTTPHFHEGSWYFFVNTPEPANETFLFYADRFDGQWHYHPVNPICSDARRAGGAGALFWHGSKLIRPSRDRSVLYASAIALNEITRLSPTEYEERVTETIQPNWLTGLLGTGTFNRCGKFEAIDGLRYEQE